MKIKLNTAMKSYAKGQEITIGDENGVPIDPFWRRRLKDAKIDNSIEIVQTKPETKPKRNSRSSANDNAS